MKTRYEAEVDPSDDESLKKFFDDHYDYTTLELRLKYNIPTSTLNTWRRRVNRQKDRPKPFFIIGPFKIYQIRIFVYIILKFYIF